MSLLRCDHCGAPLPSGSANEVACKYCGTTTRVATAIASVDRPTHVHRERYAVGESVLVEWNDRFWPARILEKVRDDAYLIHYDGYSASWDEVVGLDRIEPRDASDARSSGRTIRKAAPVAIGAVAVALLLVALIGIAAAMVLLRSPTRSSSSTPPASSRPLAAYEPLAPGTRIYVSWNGSWYESTVLGDFGTTVRIHYVGWSDSWDENVTRDRIRIP